MEFINLIVTLFLYVCAAFLGTAPAFAFLIAFAWVLERKS
jgi:hypothetical protein